MAIKSDQKQVKEIIALKQAACPICIYACTTPGDKGYTGHIILHVSPVSVGPITPLGTL